MSLRPALGCAAPIEACAALTSDDLPMPRAPHNSALFAGRPRAKRSVFSTKRSRTRSIPLRSDMSTRLTRRTAASLRLSGCQMKASAAEKSDSGGGGGARRSNALAIRASTSALPSRGLGVPVTRATFLIAFLLEREGDLAMIAPGCGLSLSGAGVGSQAHPQRSAALQLGQRQL